ncbi:MAG: hypothetical protein IPO93_17500 [Actinobacteria bacterium]|nr:hypothetical protein [Actinomycetota bacterium]
MRKLIEHGTRNRQAAHPGVEDTDRRVSHGAHSLRRGAARTHRAGNSQQIPAFYLFINGLLSFILGIMYFWLARMAMIGSATAYTIINLLAMLNIFFGLLRLPYGWAEIVLNALVLVIVNGRAAKEWFTRAA